MILATRLSVIKKVCSSSVLNQLKEIYKNNSLSYTFKNFSNANKINT